MEIFGNGPGVYLPPVVPPKPPTPPPVEPDPEPVKPPARPAVRRLEPANTNNNNIYGGGRLSVDSLKPRHRACFTEGPEYPRSAFSRLGTSETPRGDGRKQQKEFFKEELKRLQSSLKREASKIKAPPVQKHKPFIYNTLEPYYNFYTAQYLIELQDQQKPTYSTRPTSMGLCDPWVNYKMDAELLPRIEVKHHAPLPPVTPREGKNKPQKEGSTRLPRFPAVSLPTGDLATRELHYSDVPELRDELRKKYSSNANAKIDEDYTKTKQDFYRMDLDRMQDYHPVSRPSMRAAYFAYLQNTPGSRKAVHECVKATEKATAS